MDRIKTIQRMRVDRYKYKDIAKELGISRQWIWYLLKRENNKKSAVNNSKEPHK